MAGALLLGCGPRKPDATLSRSVDGAGGARCGMSVRTDEVQEHGVDLWIAEGPRGLPGADEPYVEMGPLPWRAGKARYHEIYEMAFSPDGRTLAMGTADRRVVLLGADGNEAVVALPKSAEDAAITAMAYERDGSYIVATYDGFLRRFGGTALTAMRRLSNPVKHLAFSPDGGTLACGYIGDLPGTGGRVRKADGNGFQLVLAPGAVAWYGNDKIVYTPRHGEIVIHVLATGEERTVVRLPYGVFVITSYSNNRVCAAGGTADFVDGNGCVSMVDCANGTVLWSYETGVGATIRRCVVGDSDLVIGMPRYKDRIFVWDGATGKLRQELEGTCWGTGYPLAVSPRDGTLMTGALVGEQGMLVVFRRVHGCAGRYGRGASSHPAR